MRLIVLAGLCLVSVTWIVFWQVYDFEFVNLDDLAYVTENPMVNSGFSWNNVVAAFSTTAVGGFWQPLVWLSLMLDAELFGDRAGGFHLTNVVFHTANVLLLFALLWRMTGDVWKSWFVAALFAVHPLHVESVAWVTERKDVLFTFFGLIAMLAYVRHARQRSIAWYWIAWTSFACSLMSKQMLVTLPAVLLLLDYWPLRRVQWTWSSRKSKPATTKPIDEFPVEPASTPTFRPQPVGRLLVEKVPFLVLTVLFCVFAIVAQERGGAVRTMDEYPLGIRCQNAVLVYGLYLRMTVWPHDLAAVYPHPGDAIAAADVAISAVVLTLLTLFALRQIRRRPYLLVGWLWYLGTLVPIIGLVQVGVHQMADRFTYIPLIGVFIGVAWLVPSLIPAGLMREWLPAGLAAAAVIACTVLAYRQTQTWRNSNTLFEHALAVTTDNPMVHEGLATTLSRQRKFEEAAEHYLAAIEIEHEYPRAHVGLAIVRYRQGRLDEAIEHLEQAIDLEPWNVDARFKMGEALRKQGKTDEAIAQIQKVVSLEPDYLQAQFTLANLLRDRGERKSAISHYERAVRIDPNNPLVRYNLGNALLQQGSLNKALFHFQKVVELKPKHSRALNNIGVVYHSQARYAEALPFFEQAYHLDPQSEPIRKSLTAAYVNLGGVLFRRGATEPARSRFADALRVDPQSAEAHHGLGVLLLRLDQRDAAIKHLREAVRIKPDFAAAREDLKRALAK